MCHLAVSKFQERTKVLGPGDRTVIWFHGCSRNCPECIARTMNESPEFESLTPDQLAERVLAVEGTEGITLSGGEPFEQDIPAMHDFLNLIRRKSPLSVMVYSGYLLSELKADAEKSLLLPFLDILVDGPYVNERNDGSLWKGSSNQTIHFLSERYAAIAEQVRNSKGRPLEIQISADMKLDLTGIPPAGFKTRLEKELNKKQLNIQW